MFLSGNDWYCGMISVSMAGFWRSLKLGVRLKLGNGEVLGTCGLTVHQSINAYLSFSETRVCNYINVFNLLWWFVKFVLETNFFLIIKTIIPVSISLIFWVSKLCFVIWYLRYRWKICRNVVFDCVFGEWEFVLCVIALHRIVLYKLPGNWWENFIKCSVCVIKCNCWVRYYMLSCQYFRWPVESWHF